MAVKKGQLTEKQFRFVEAYVGEACGNASKAARMAGYRGNESVIRTMGQENMTKPIVRAAIEERRKKVWNPATVEEVIQFFTDAMRDEDLPLRDRARCAENLARTMELFSERRVVEARVEVNDVRDKFRRFLSSIQASSSVDAIEDALIATSVDA